MANDKEKLTYRKVKYITQNDNNEVKLFKGKAVEEDKRVRWYVNRINETPETKDLLDNGVKTKKDLLTILPNLVLVIVDYPGFSKGTKTSIPYILRNVFKNNSLHVTLEDYLVKRLERELDKKVRAYDSYFNQELKPNMSILVSSLLHQALMAQDKALDKEPLKVLNEAEYQEDLNNLNEDTWEENADNGNWDNNEENDWQNNNNDWNNQGW